MKIGLCGFYGKSNFGDDLMADCLPKILRICTEDTVTVFSDCDSNNVINATKNLHLLYSQDILVIGGGGIISSSFWALSDRVVNGIIDNNIPVIFLNVNVTKEIIENPHLGEKIKKLNARWWVRDFYSSDMLAKIDVQSAVLPDISFNMSPDFNATKKDKKITFFANSYILNNAFKNDDTFKYIEAQKVVFSIANFLDWMTTFGWKIKLMPAQTGGEFDDRISSGLIYGIMKNKNAVEWTADKVNWNTIVNEIAESELVISMRFHASTTALALGIPLIDITHHTKNKNLFVDLNCEQISVDCFSINQHSLIDAANASSKIDANNIRDYINKSIVLWNNFSEDWQSILDQMRKQEAR